MHRSSPRTEHPTSPYPPADLKHSPEAADSERGAGAGTAAPRALAAYPPVTLRNGAPGRACGKVEYVSIFCSDHPYCVEAGQTWSGPDRSVCLISRITASVEAAGGGTVAAEPYLSSGTSYSAFELVQRADGGYTVQRIR